MPYIAPEVRHASMARIRDGVAMPGDLNFVLSCIVDEYLVGAGVNYTKLNDVMGVLACMQAEVYRRIAAPYEDQKLAENGDVFQCLS